MMLKQVSSFPERLREAMNGELSSAALGERIGLSKQAISAYTSGTRKPKPPTMAALASALGVSMPWLMGFDCEKKPASTGELVAPRLTESVVSFPVLGEVAAGYDHMAAEDWSGESLDIPEAYLHGRPREDYFVLRVHGNSMYPLYLDGDRVLILRQSTLRRSGDIGVILYGGDQATLKKVEYEAGSDWMRLVPLNPEYMPRTIEGADLEQCRVLGVPKMLIRDI